MWACDARRDPELLARCYAASPQGYWTNLRNDVRMHARIAALLERFAGGRQLCDVGCGDGRLLMALRTRWRVHGLEAAPAAVEPPVESYREVVDAGEARPDAAAT